MAEHVRLHGGAVWIEDTPGGGSRFIVELPFASDDVAGWTPGAGVPAVGRRPGRLAGSRRPWSAWPVLDRRPCGIPTDGTPTAIAKSDVPFHLLNPVTPTTLAPAPRPR